MHYFKRIPYLIIRAFNAHKLEKGNIDSGLFIVENRNSDTNKRLISIKILPHKNNNTLYQIGQSID